MIPSLNTGIRVIQFSEDRSKVTLTWLRLKSKRSKRHAFRVISKYRSRARGDDRRSDMFLTHHTSQRGEVNSL